MFYFNLSPNGKTMTVFALVVLLGLVLYPFATFATAADNIIRDPVKTGAGAFQRPIEVLPTMKQHGSPVYAYLFTAVPEGWRNQGVVGWHAIDVAYLFAPLEASFVEANPAYLQSYVARQGAKDLDPGITEADRQLSLKMKKIWAQFAATGNPSIEGVVDWPPYKPDTDYYLQIDLPLEVKAGFSKLTQEKEFR